MPTIRLPGLIDPHVHLREPGGTHKEDFETGTRAALAGGVTMVCAMPNTQPPLIDRASLTLAEEAAAERAVCDYGIYLGASSRNLATASGLANRTVGLKFYLDTTFGSLHIPDLNTLREHFARWPKDRPILCHAEERTIAAVLTCAYLENRSVYICHVSRRDEIELIRDAKMRGIDVTCEVTSHHLAMTDEDGEKLGRGRREVRPTLATKADQNALWAYMDVIDVIATDHAPHLLVEKDSPNPPPGFPGLEWSLALMLTAVDLDLISLEEVKARMYDNPLRIFGLPAQPETWIEVDPDLQWTARAAEMVSRCGWTPYEGWTLTGRVIRTVLRGKTVYENGQFRAEPGTARNLAPASRQREKQ